MKIPYYVVDAFTDKIFGGGPAGVVITDQPLSETLMQNIAMENNLADTAFVTPAAGAAKSEDVPAYDLRWFMPEGEIDLNGHATLAAAYCLFQDYVPHAQRLAFRTRERGLLQVAREGKLLALDMPAVFNEPIELTPEMVDALGEAPAESYFGQNLFFVFETEKQIRELTPDFNKMKALPLGNGVFVSAPGDGEHDIAARTFWPKMGVNEDPVCGNMHCNLTPFWCRRLGKKEIVSHQLSRRGATVVCEDRGDRALLKGEAALFLKTELVLEI